jgi:2'-5' RNA ligase
MVKARLFVGTFLDAESAAFVSKLKELNSDLSIRWQLKARFVPLQKLHLTWLFIGDVERNLVETIKSDLKNTIETWKGNNQNSSFDIEYDVAEVWPSLKAPRVLVLESTSNEIKSDGSAHRAPAEALNSAINEGLGSYCERSDKVERFKVFRPHLTVCRFSTDIHTKGSGRVKRSLDEFQTPENLFPLIHKIGTVSLIESNLNAGPNAYSSILDISL